MSDIDNFLSSGTSETPNETSNLNRLSIEYVFVRVNENPLEKVPGLIQQAIATALASDAEIDAILSSLVLITFSSLIEDHDLQERRQELVWQLKEELHGNAAILHGSCWGMRGDVRSSQAYCISAVLPNLSEMLSELGKLALNGEKEMSFS